MLVQVYVFLTSQRKRYLYDYFNQLLAKLQGCKGYQNLWGKPENLNFFGFQRDHVGTEVLEAKNVVNRAKNCKKHLNFQCFLSLAAPKWDGRARN